MENSANDQGDAQTTAEAIVSGAVILLGLGAAFLFSLGKYAILEARSKVWDRFRMELRK